MYSIHKNPIGISETVAMHVKELNYQGMFLVEMWADNSSYQSMEQAKEKIAEAFRFVTEKMHQAGLAV